MFCLSLYTVLENQHMWLTLVGIFTYKLSYCSVELDNYPLWRGIFIIKYKYSFAKNILEGIKKRQVELGVDMDNTGLFVF